MGVCGMTDLGAYPGQMSVIPDGTAAVGEVIIQTFEAMDIWYAYCCLDLLICSEHLFWILSLAYKADMQVGGFVSGRKWHV